MKKPKIQKLKFILKGVKLKKQNNNFYLKINPKFKNELKKVKDLNYNEKIYVKSLSALLLENLNTNFVNYGGSLILENLLTSTFLEKTVYISIDSFIGSNKIIKN